jgi:peptide/nickel transport system substrate-binding protein
VADSQISPDEPNYQAMQQYVVKYQYDPRQAMAQLDSMGLTKGDDGFYRDASGQKLTVEVRTRAHVLREKVQQVIANDWAKIGIVGQPLVVPEQNINDRVYQSTFPAFYFRFGDPSQITDARSNDVPLPENNFVGRNITRYRSAELDSIINKYVSTIPKSEREPLLGQIVHQYTDQLILLTLYHEPEPVLISNRMVNVAGRKGFGIQTWNVWDWDLKS